MFRLFRPVVAVLLAVIFAPVTAATASAEQTPSSSETADQPAEAAGPALKLELNEIGADGDICRITFVVHNGLSSDISALAYEMVLFGSDGGIKRMTKFDFGAMKQDKTIVRRFNMPGLDCAAISRILINGAASCEGADQSGSCEQALATSNRTGIEFGL